MEHEKSKKLLKLFKISVIITVVAMFCGFKASSSYTSVKSMNYVSANNITSSNSIRVAIKKVSIAPIKESSTASTSNTKENTIVMNDRRLFAIMIGAGLLLMVFFFCEIFSRL